MTMVDAYNHPLKQGDLVFIFGWGHVGRICEIGIRGQAKGQFTLAAAEETIFNKKTKIYRSGTELQKKKWYRPSQCIRADTEQGKHAIKTENEINEHFMKIFKKDVGGK